MDNTTALKYIKKLGSTVLPELNRLTKDLWTWCLEREITLQATHLVGALNVTADEESCVMKDRIGCYVPKPSGGSITSLDHYRWIYLQACRLTHQLYWYDSWRPDPCAMTTDAFTLNWVEFRGYANPLWNLITRVLTQARIQKARLVGEHNLNT